MCWFVFQLIYTSVDDISPLFCISTSICCVVLALFFQFQSDWSVYVDVFETLYIVSRSFDFFPEFAAVFKCLVETGKIAQISSRCSLVGRYTYVANTLTHSLQREKEHIIEPFHRLDRLANVTNATPKTTFLSSCLFHFKMKCLIYGVS